MFCRILVCCVRCECVVSDVSVLYRMCVCSVSIVPCVACRSV